MSTRPTSPDVPFPAASDFNFLLLGFRLGQILAACESTSDEDPLASLLPPMLSNATIAAESFRGQAIATSVEEAVSASRDIWRRRTALSEEHGSAVPYLQIGGVIRIAIAGIRNELPARRGPAVLFRIGRLLGMGVGDVYPDALDAGAHWDYVALDGSAPADELDGLTTQLGVTLEQLTGLPADPSDFLQTVDGVDEILARYSRNWWGWAFIEDRISEIRAGTYTFLKPAIVPPAVEPGYLGLLMSEDRSIAIRRAGMSTEVSLTETQFRLLREYYNSGASGVLKSNLMLRWGRISQREAERPDAAINTHNSELRKRLKPLRISLLATGQGADQRWRLAELTVDGE